MKTEHLISRILHLGRIYDLEKDDSKREDLVDRMENIVKENNKQLLLQPIKLKSDFKLDEEFNDVGARIIKDITDTINKHNDEMLKIILNDAINKAFNSNNRIRGVVSSNKIGNFVNEYLDQNNNDTV